MKKGNGYLLSILLFKTLTWMPFFASTAHYINWKRKTHEKNEDLRNEQTQRKPIFSLKKV